MTLSPYHNPQGWGKSISPISSRRTNPARGGRSPACLQPKPWSCAGTSAPRAGGIWKRSTRSQTRASDPGCSPAAHGQKRNQKTPNSAWGSLGRGGRRSPEQQTSAELLKPSGGSREQSPALSCLISGYRLQRVRPLPKNTHCPKNTQCKLS